MTKTQTGEILRVSDPADAVEALDETVADAVKAPLPEAEQEYVPDQPVPFEASSADIAEQHAEVPTDPAEDYR